MQQANILDAEQTETKRKMQSLEERTSNLWILDPEIETNTSEEAVCKNAKSLIPPVTKKP